MYSGQKARQKAALLKVEAVVPCGWAVHLRAAPTPTDRVRGKAGRNFSGSEL